MPENRNRSQHKNKQSSYSTRMIGKTLPWSMMISMGWPAFKHDYVDGKLVRFENVIICASIQGLCKAPSFITVDQNALNSICRRLIKGCNYFLKKYVKHILIHH